MGNQETRVEEADTGLTNVSPCCDVFFVIHVYVCISVWAQVSVTIVQVFYLAF